MATDSRVHHGDQSLGQLPPTRGGGASSSKCASLVPEQSQEQYDRNWNAEKPKQHSSPKVHRQFSSTPVITLITKQ
jgi:hypothetical protein